MLRQSQTEDSASMNMNRPKLSGILRPNNSLQRTRLRRAVTSRSLSQAFGLATVRVYHRRAPELNR